MLAAAGVVQCAAHARCKPALTCGAGGCAGVGGLAAGLQPARRADGYVDYPALFRGLAGPGPRRDYWSALAGRPASTALLAAPAALADAKPCAGFQAAPGRPWLPWEAAQGACGAERQMCSGAADACTAAANRPVAAPAAGLAQGQEEAQQPAHGRADDAWADAAVVRAAAVAAASAAAHQGDVACAQGRGRPATACGATPPCKEGVRQPHQRPQSAAAGVRCRQAAFERARYDAAASVSAAAAGDRMWGPRAVLVLTGGAGPSGGDLRCGLAPAGRRVATPHLLQPRAPGAPPGIPGLRWARAACRDDDAMRRRAAAPPSQRARV